MDELNPAAPEPVDTYMSLTHISWDWGVPLRSVASELESAGYRRFGTPTKKALDDRLALRRKRSGFHWSHERLGQFIEQRIDCEKPITPKRYLVVPIIIE